MTRAILVMAKAPIAGRSKTRLTPMFTESQAAELSSCFIRDAAELAESVDDTDVFLAITPPGAESAFADLLPGRETISQRGDSLGERLAHVLTAALGRGYAQVIAINSDGPNLPQSFLAEAFARLDDAGIDLVLGPAVDGGYYLIGWKRPLPATVVEVTMSTPRVLDDTLAIARRDGLTVALLDAWYDVDEPTDLDRLREDTADGVSCGRWTRMFLEALS